MDLISVIIPVRNGEAFVADAVESVLTQQDVPAELIVVDDGSTDDTPHVLARFAGRITLDSSDGRGVSAARNRGMASAQGDLLVFLDADDLLPPHYLARFVEAAAAASRAEVFHCGWRGIEFEADAFSTGRTCHSTSTGTPSTPLPLQVRRPSRRSPYAALQPPG